MISDNLQKNMQEIFDKGLTHIRKQGGQTTRLDGNSVCSYRDVHGGSCIIGSLISDNDYDPYFDDCDDSSVKGLLGSSSQFRRALINSGVCISPDTNRHAAIETFLVDLQTAHDNDYMDSNDDGRPWMYCFELYMKILANTYNLSYNPI